ncbi:MAG: hypothetical protein ACJAXL_001278, partial [Alphaproteobacteria bacterium]
MTSAVTSNTPKTRFRQFKQKAGKFTGVTALKTKLKLDKKSKNDSNMQATKAVQFITNRLEQASGTLSSIKSGVNKVGKGVKDTTNLALLGIGGSIMVGVGSVAVAG